MQSPAAGSQQARRLGDSADDNDPIVEDQVGTDQAGPSSPRHMSDEEVSSVEPTWSDKIIFMSVQPLSLQKAMLKKYWHPLVHTKRRGKRQGNLRINMLCSADFSDSA